MRELTKRDKMFYKACNLFEEHGCSMTRFGSEEKGVLIYVDDEEKMINFKDKLGEIRQTLKDAGAEIITFMKCWCRLAQMKVEDFDEDALEYLAFGPLSESAYLNTKCGYTHWDVNKNFMEIAEIKECWERVDTVANMLGLIVDLESVKDWCNYKGRIAKIHLKLDGKSIEIHQYLRYVYIKDEVGNEEVLDKLLKAIFSSLFKTCDAYRVICNGKLHEVNRKITDYDSRMSYHERLQLNTVWAGDVQNTTKGDISICMKVVDKDIHCLTKHRDDEEWEKWDIPLYLTYDIKDVIAYNKKYDYCKQIPNANMLAYILHREEGNNEAYTPEVDKRIIYMDRAFRELSFRRMYAVISLSDNDEIVHELYREPYDFLCRITSDVRNPRALRVEGLDERMESQDAVRCRKGCIEYLRCLCLAENKYILETKKYGDIPLYLTDGSLYPYDGELEDLIKTVCSNDETSYIIKHLYTADELEITNKSKIYPFNLYVILTKDRKCGYCVKTCHNELFISSTIHNSNNGCPRFFGIDKEEDWYNNPNVVKDKMKCYRYNGGYDKEPCRIKGFEDLMKSVKDANCVLKINGEHFSLMECRKEDRLEEMLDFMLPSGGEKFYGMVKNYTYTDLSEHSNLVDKIFKAMDKITQARRYVMTGNWEGRGDEIKINKEEKSQQPTKTTRLTLE